MGGARSSFRCKWPFAAGDRRREHSEELRCGDSRGPSIRRLLADDLGVRALRPLLQAALEPCYRTPHDGRDRVLLAPVFGPEASRPQLKSAEGRVLSVGPDPV